MAWPSASQTFSNLQLHWPTEPLVMVPHWCYSPTYKVLHIHWYMLHIPSIWCWVFQQGFLGSLSRLHAFMRSFRETGEKGEKPSFLFPMLHNPSTRHTADSRHIALYKREWESYRGHAINAIFSFPLSWNLLSLNNIQGSCYRLGGSLNRNTPFKGRNISNTCCRFPLTTILAAISLQS